MLPNEITKSTKREASNALVKVFARKEGDGPVEVFDPRTVSPRQIASGGPKEGDASRDAALKK